MTEITDKITDDDVKQFISNRKNMNVLSALRNFVARLEERGVFIKAGEQSARQYEIEKVRDAFSKHFIKTSFDDDNCPFCHLANIVKCSKRNLKKQQVGELIEAEIKRNIPFGASEDTKKFVAIKIKEHIYGFFPDCAENGKAENED